MLLLAASICLLTLTKGEGWQRECEFGMMSWYLTLGASDIVAAVDKVT